jgi:SH3 domain
MDSARAAAIAAAQSAARNRGRNRGMSRSQPSSPRTIAAIRRDWDAEVKQSNNASISETKAVIPASTSVPTLTVDYAAASIPSIEDATNRYRSLEVYIPDTSNGSHTYVPLVEDEIVDVLEESSSEWWYVRNAQGNEGYVPASFLVRDRASQNVSSSSSSSSSHVQMVPPTAVAPASVYSPNSHTYSKSELTSTSAPHVTTGPVPVPQPKPRVAQVPVPVPSSRTIRHTTKPATKYVSNPTSTSASTSSSASRVAALAARFSGK